MKRLMLYISGLLTGRYEGIVGLDIGSSALKAVQLKPVRDGFELVHIAHQSLEADTIVDGHIIDLSHVSDSINRIWSDQNIKSRQVATSLSGSAVVVKLILVPQMSDEELDEEIHWEADNYIPFDINDVDLYHKVIEQDPTSPNMEVFLVACKRDKIAQFTQVISRAGKQPVIVDVDAFALQNAYVFNYNPTPSDTVVLLDIGASIMTINVVHGTTSIYTRDISMGGNQYTELLQREFNMTFEQAEALKRGMEPGEQMSLEQVQAVITSVSEMLALEMQRALDFLRAIDVDSPNIDRMLIAGGSSKVSKLCECLSELFQMPVERFDAFRSIHFDSERFDDEYLKGLSPNMAVAVGLALRGAASTLPSAIEIGPQVNLLKSRMRGMESKYHRESGILNYFRRPLVGSTMPTYVFKGRNKWNEIVVGERLASDRAALAAMLRREQVVLTSAREKGRARSLPIIRRQKVRSKDLALFTRQFSLMLDAGLPLLQCFEILGQQRNTHFQNVISQTRSDVEAGMTLADAMAKHPHVFGPLYTNLIAAGETGGVLDIILQRLSTYLDKMVKLNGAIKRAIIYPIAVIVISIIVISIIMIVVMPAFKSIFEGLPGTGEKLPRVTEIGVSISQYLAGFWWLIALVVGGFVFAIKAWYKTDLGVHVIDGMILRLPMLGDIMHKISISRFSRTLSTLMNSGVPILDSLDITARASGNIIIAEAIIKVRTEIERGETFVAPLRASGVFPMMVSGMIAIGEQTGALGAILSIIADFYEQEVDSAITNLLSLRKAAAIAFIAVTIGTVVIAMCLSLFILIGKLASGH